MLTYFDGNSGFLRIKSVHCREESGMSCGERTRLMTGCSWSSMEDRQIGWLFFLPVFMAGICRSTKNILRGIKRDTAVSLLVLLHFPLTGRIPHRRRKLVFLHLSLIWLIWEKVFLSNLTKPRDVYAGTAMGITHLQTLCSSHQPFWIVSDMHNVSTNLLRAAIIIKKSIQMCQIPALQPLNDSARS